MLKLIGVVLYLLIVLQSAKCFAFTNIQLKRLHTRNSTPLIKISQSQSRITTLFNSFDLNYFNQNVWFQYALIASSAATSIQFEKTKFGQLLSAPVLSMLISVILTNLNILPSEGSTNIRSVVDMTVKLATPLLLLNADLKRIYNDTGGSLLYSFLLGTVGTVAGSNYLYDYKCTYQ